MAAIASAPACWQPSTPPAPSAANLYAQVLVGSVIAQRASAVCPADATLADAADLLISSDHTAAGVVDASGAVLGAITENDILQAYAEGAPPLSSVAAWLQSGHARMPQSALREHAVLLETPLLAAVAQMRALRSAHAEAAFRHLVVFSGAGAFAGILSALDIARALCRLEAQSGVLHRLAGEVAADAMKPLAALPVVPTTATLGTGLLRMAATHQNCVLVMDGVSAVPDGILTPRDALRAFADHVPLETVVGCWLRGLQSDWESRAITADTRLSQVAALMAARSVHHLVVLAPVSVPEVVGVVSSSDLAQIAGLAEYIADPRSQLPMEM